MKGRNLALAENYLFGRFFLNSTLWLVLYNQALLKARSSKSLKRQTENYQSIYLFQTNFSFKIFNNKIFNYQVAKKVRKLQFEASFQLLCLDFKRPLKNLKS